MNCRTSGKGGSGKQLLLGFPVTRHKVAFKRYAKTPVIRYKAETPVKLAAQVTSHSNVSFRKAVAVWIYPEISCK